MWEKRAGRKDLSNFKGQIIMARPLGWSFSETTRLVGFSHVAVVNTYRQWSRESWNETAPGCIVGRRQAYGGSVMLWTMFCWKTLGPGIHLDVNFSHATYLTTLWTRYTPSWQWYSSMAVATQQDNVPCHTAQIIQEWSEQHDVEFKVLPWPPDSQIHGGSISQGLKRSVANILAQDTTGHVQSPCRVHALACQSCFGGTWITY